VDDRVWNRACRRWIATASSGVLVGMTDVLGSERTVPAMGSTVQALTSVGLLASASVAGIFFAFSSFVMPALARMPADRGIAAMQSINITAVRPVFMSVLFGTALLCLGLTVVGFRALGAGYAVPLLAGSLLYLAGVILLTMVVHVPLNDELATLDPVLPDSAAVWSQYLSRWGAANQLRWICPLGSAMAFLLALRRS
jgi:uncharacterized membrane protein